MAKRQIDEGAGDSFSRPSSGAFGAGADPRGADDEGCWPMSNIGSGTPTIVRDRVPKAPLTPNYSSVPQSLKGRGLNKETMNESLDENLNQGGGGLEGDVDRTWGE